ncbi:hypothetical protein KAR48_04420 [bacterium]|nr:hypothetical protein [bacterium]
MKFSISQIISNVFDQSRLTYYLIIAPLTGTVVGLFVIQEDPILMLIGFFIAGRALFFNNSKILPYVIILPVWFADWFFALGYIPASFTWLPDVALVIFTIKVVIMRLIDKEIVRTHIDIPFAAFTIWAVISMVVNDQSPLSMFFSMRQMFKYAVMFYLFVHINYDEKFLKRLNLLLLGIFIIQIPTALIKMTIFGRTEWAIGTYAYFGGGLSAILPLFVNSICLGFYLYDRTKWQYLGFMVYFQLFYYACPKRVYPLFAMASITYLLIRAGKKNFKKVLPLTPLAVIIIALALYVSPNWNELFTNPQGAMDWATSYTYQKNEEVTSGRAAVAELVIKTLINNPVKFLFGYGPGTLTESFVKNKDSVMDSLSIYYGITEFALISLEYGFVGLGIFCWILITLYRTNHRLFLKIDDPYWKAISFGYKGVIFISFLALVYTPIFRLDVSGFMIWYIFTILYIVGRQKGILLYEK